MTPLVKPVITWLRLVVPVFVSVPPTGTQDAAYVNVPTATPPAPPTQVLSKLRATKKLLTRGKAFSFSFNLTLPGKVQVLFAKAGAKGGARSLKVSGKTGTNKVTIPVRFLGATLKRGTYRITVKPQATAAQKLTVSLR